MCGCCGDSDEKKTSSLFKNRGCTDILFLIFFVFFICGHIYVGVFAIVKGDAFRLIYGYDSFGNTCNEGNNFEIKNVTGSGADTLGKNNVFFMSILDPFDSMQICVKSCPPDTLATPFQVKEFAENNGTRLCRYDVPIEDYLDFKLYGKNGPCPQLPIYKSISLLNRCIPNFLDLDLDLDLTNITRLMNSDDFFRQGLADLYISWKEMLVLCAVAFGFALLLVFLIRFLAALLVWLIVILAAVGSIALTAFLWWTYIETKKERQGSDERKIPIVNLFIKNETAFMIMAIVATVLTVILLLIIIVMRKRLALTVALFHEAARCLSSICCLLFQPIWTFLILMVFLIYWVIVLAFIATAGDPVPDYSKGFVSVEYKPSDTLRYLTIYHFVGLIWGAEFIIACQQLVIAGAVATWYFTRDKKSLDCPIGKSICRLILHHLGSAAFGSFIITLVKIPRFILMYIQKKCKGNEDPCSKFCLKCCICCLWCLEKCLKFLNQNAYTIIAIKGNNFCSAAKDAFKIIVDNVLRVAAINSVGAFVLFLGKIGVMAATAAVGVLWLKDKESLHFYPVPIVLVCIFGYFIAHVFFSIYEMVIDSLLLCFCEDCNMNDGSSDKEYYMPTSLMKFVNNSKRRLDEIDGKMAPTTEEETAQPLTAMHEL